jgi:hypothetical protein
MTNKEIKSALMQSGTIFTMPTKLSSRGETVEFKMLRFSEPFSSERPEVGLSVSVNKLFGQSMNVEKIGTKTMSMFTYTMMGTRCVETMRFEDITIVSVGDK